MDVITLSPRGYCHGVVSAVSQLRALATDKDVRRPVHVLGMLVHNQKIVDDFEALGIHTIDARDKTRLELLEEIESGTVVFTAHGVGDEVINRALLKGLDIVDTTCRDVKTSQNTVKDFVDRGYEVLFIGKEGHPETETVAAYSEKVHIVTSKDDLDDVRITAKKAAITNQTTMSLFDVYSITEKAKARFPFIEEIEEICDATRTRQLAVKNQPARVDHCFVVGDRRSNNSNKLVEVAKNAGFSASLVETVEDLDVRHLGTLKTVSVTSGASTPTRITREVIDYLKRFDRDDKNTHPKESRKSKANLFR